MSHPILHITFACTGNICRSPMAEKIFAARLEQAGPAERVRVSSAGTTGGHVGEEADRRTNATPRARGGPEHGDALLTAEDTVGACAD